MSRRTVYLGFHIAKTGGTTIFNNLKTGLGPERFYLYGRTADVRRYFGQEPEWFDMSLEDFRKIEVFFGHQVSSRLLSALHQYDGRACDFALFTCFRHPRDWFRSFLTHHNLANPWKADLTAEQAVEKFGTNRFSHRIWNSFGDLVDGEYSFENVLKVLKCFKHIGQTERLSETTADLFHTLGLNPLEGVFRKATKYDEISSAALEGYLEQSQEDMELWKMIDGGRPSDISFCEDTLEKGLAKLKTVPFPVHRSTSYVRITKSLRRADRVWEAKKAFQAGYISHPAGPILDQMNVIDRMKPTRIKKNAMRAIRFLMEHKEYKQVLVVGKHARKFVPGDEDLKSFINRAELGLQKDKEIASHN